MEQQPLPQHLQWTPHARMRSHQRQIPEAAVRLTLESGQCLTQASGQRIYWLTRRHITTLGGEIAGQLLPRWRAFHLVVVVSPSRRTVITCRWQKRAPGR